MNFAHGAIQWLAADAATTTYTVSGQAFQPKAIRFYWNGLQSSTDIVSSGVSQRRGVGFAVDTSNRRAIGTFSQTPPITSNCGAAARNDCVACTTDGAGASDGRLDLNAINSDGFQLIVDDATPANITVFWEAWGGADITVASVGDFAEPAAIGDQNYTVTGFVSGVGGQVIMFAGCQSASAINTDAAESSGLYIGFASSNAAADQCNVMGSADDASASMDTDGHCDDGQCVAMVSTAGAATLNAAAKLATFITDGFRLTWVSVSAAARKSAFLAIKGGLWKAGSYTIEGQTLNATATVSGLTFAPKGVSLIGRMTAEQSATATSANDRIGIGTGTSTSSRRSIGILDEDATASSFVEIDTTIQYDQVLCFPSTTGTLQSAYDISQMNADGFQIIVDTNGGVTAEWQGYLTFGDAPITGLGWYSNSSIGWW